MIAGYICALCLSSDAGTVKNNKRPKHKNPICMSDHLSHTLSATNCFSGYNLRLKYKVSHDNIKKFQSLPKEGAINYETKYLIILLTDNFALYRACKKKTRLF